MATVAMDASALLLLLLRQVYLPERPDKGCDFGRGRRNQRGMRTPKRLRVLEFADLPGPIRSEPVGEISDLVELLIGVLMYLDFSAVHVSIEKTSFVRVNGENIDVTLLAELGSLVRCATANADPSKVSDSSHFGDY